MQIFETAVVKLSRGLDFFAGIILAATAFLIVGNILGRALLGSSILGTYEMVGFFTASAVGLALGRCALENSHIAIGFLLERFPTRLQRGVEMAVGFPAAAFLCFITYHLFMYGSRMAASGVVSSTTQMAFYPFIYLVALGFLVLALAVLLKTVQLFSGGEPK